MDRNKLAGLLLVAVLATISLAGFFTYDFSGSAPASIEAALGNYSTDVDKRLYPPSDPRSSSVEEQSPRHALFVIFKDRSTEDVMLAPGSANRLSSIWYYPEQAGESGRRPYIKRLYGPKNLLVDEQVLQLSGLLVKSTHYTPETKTRYIVDFAADGETHLREQVFTDPGCCSGERLMRDEQWRDDAAHSLAYRNLYNEDETRTITRFDLFMNVLERIVWPKYESVSGMKLQKYYPDTHTLRVQAEGEGSADIARFYRKDGTLEAIVTITIGTTQIRYFDATGTRERLMQYWFRKDVKKDGVITSSTYKLYTVTEFDDGGNKLREVSYSDGVLNHEEFYNVTIDGVHFVELDYDYDKDTQTVKTVRYWKDEVKYPPYKLEEHTPDDKLTATPISAESLRMQLQVDSDLPVPPPQFMH